MRQPLKDLAAICAGQGAPQGDHNYCENGTPFVKAGNLQELLEGKAITSIQKVSDEVAKSIDLGSILKEQFYLPKVECPA